MDGSGAISNHSNVPAYPRCAALLRNGQPCGRTAADGSEFCVHHTQLLTTVDAETLRQGRTPKHRRSAKQTLRVVSESAADVGSTGGGPVANADPAIVRPSLAAAAAENLERLTTSLLEAAGSAVKPVWLTVQCDHCGARAQVEAPVPDVRARLAAIELLLREGLGRAPQAEEAPASRLPANLAAMKEMGWDEMQALFAALYADEIAAAQRDGGESLVRAKVAALSAGERRVLREALREPERA